MDKGILKVLSYFAIVLIASCVNKPKTIIRVKKRIIIHKPLVKQILQSDSTISITAVGDMMLGSGYPNPYNLPPDSGRNSFALATKLLKNADVTFGNLEGTLLDSGAPDFGKRNKAYLFRMPTYYGSVFKNAGFNLLSIANNHINDFGACGRKSTMHTLDSLGINYAGLQSKPSSTFTVRGVRYGFCAFSPNSYVMSLHDHKMAGQIITGLKKQVDIVIVSFHGGGEGVGYEHVTGKKESFIGENRGDVHGFAHDAIDAGADIILGNGPHVSRAMELYKHRLIAYSLGNFCTYKSVSVAGICGMAPLLKVCLNKKGEFINATIFAYKQTHLKGLERDTSNKVISRIKYLTDTDFPNSGLSIAASGLVTPVN
jgi:hypothetical protein